MGYIENNRDINISLDSHSLNIVISICIILNGLILLLGTFLSCILPYNRINMLTTIASFSSFLACIFLYIGYNTSPYNRIYVDVLAYSIFRPITQLTDNYFVFSIYLLIDKNYSINNMKVKLNLYIWIFLILTYVPYGTILPIFVSMNQTVLPLLFMITAAYIYLTAYLAYYISFGWKLRSLLATQSNSEISTKNMIHIIMSCLGATIVSIEFIVPRLAPYGLLIQITLISLSLQILFNSVRDRSNSIQSTMYTSRMLQYYQQTLYKTRRNFKISPRYRPRPVNYAMYEVHSEINVKVDVVEIGSLANDDNNDSPYNAPSNNNNSSLISPKGFNFDL